MSDQSKTVVRKSSLKDSKDSKSKAQAPVVQVEAPSLHLEPLMGTPVKQPPSKSARVNSPSLAPLPGFGGAGGSEGAAAGSSAAVAEAASGSVPREMDLDEEHVDETSLAAGGGGAPGDGTKLGGGLGAEIISVEDAETHIFVSQLRFAPTVPARVVNFFSACVGSASRQDYRIRIGEGRSFT